MREIRLTPKELIQLTQLKLTKKWKWPAVFSTNPQGEIWPGITYGVTPIEHRVELSDLVPVLNRIKDLYLGVREEGGRIFVDFNGAYYKNQQKQEFQIVKFKLDI